MEYLSEFIPWHEKSQLPSISAVYAFTNAAGDLLYIGNSSNLKKRALGHSLRDLLSERDRLGFVSGDKYLFTDNPRDAEEIEVASKGAHGKN